MVEGLEEPLNKVSLSVGESSLTFDIANVPSLESYLCLGVRKSGSTLLHKIVMFLARRNHINVVDVPGTFFRNGFVAADWMAADMAEIIQPGNCYIGFRSFPSNFAATEVYASTLKVFMYRDPRDALVSQYFSDAYSHSLPVAASPGAKGAELFAKKRADALSEDIDSYVLKHAKSIDRTLANYQELLDDPTCLALRYEDYVFQKKRLVNKILKHFKWQCHPGQVDNILKQVGDLPDQEDKKKFIRKVIPGDHRDKLKPETLRDLDKKLAEVLHVFDYY